MGQHFAEKLGVLPAFSACNNVDKPRGIAQLVAIGMHWDRNGFTWPELTSENMKHEMGVAWSPVTSADDTRLDQRSSQRRKRAVMKPSNFSKGPGPVGGGRAPARPGIA